METSYRSTELANGLTLIRHIPSGLEATANPDGSYRSGVRGVWEKWMAGGGQQRPDFDWPESRHPRRPLSTVNDRPCPAGGIPCNPPILRGAIPRTGHLDA